MSWGTQAQTKEAKTTKTVEPTTRFDEAYYRELFTNNSMNAVTHRCAFVGHENTAKTGLALSLLDKEINDGKTRRRYLQPEGVERAQQALQEYPI